MDIQQYLFQVAGYYTFLSIGALLTKWQEREPTVLSKFQIARIVMQ